MDRGSVNSEPIKRHDRVATIENATLAMRNEGKAAEERKKERDRQRDRGWRTPRHLGDEETRESVPSESLRRTRRDPPIQREKPRGGVSGEGRCEGTSGGYEGVAKCSGAEVSIDSDSAS